MKLTRYIRATLTKLKSKHSDKATSHTQGTQTQNAGVAHATWHGERDEDGIPTRMLCPVSKSIMFDPVVASDENTYDRPMIMHVINGRIKKSPLTREALGPHVLPNALLRREIEAFLSVNPALRPTLTEPQQSALKQAVAAGVPKHQAMAILMASNHPDDAGAEAYLYEMPMPNRAAAAASISPGHPGSAVEQPGSRSEARRPPNFPPPPVPRLNQSPDEYANAAVETYVNAVRDAARRDSRGGAGQPRSETDSLASTDSDWSVDSDAVERVLDTF